MRTLTSIKEAKRINRDIKQGIRKSARMTASRRNHAKSESKYVWHDMPEGWNSQWDNRQKPDVRARLEDWIESPPVKIPTEEELQMNKVIIDYLENFSKPKVIDYKGGHQIKILENGVEKWVDFDFKYLGLLADWLKEVEYEEIDL